MPDVEAYLELDLDDPRAADCRGVRYHRGIRT